MHHAQLAPTEHVRWLDDLSNADVSLVGGKNASLAEMIRHLGAEGVRVPGGFATTADAYRAFLEHNQLESTLREESDALEKGERSLAEGSVDPDEYRVFKPRLGDAKRVPILAKVLGSNEKKIIYANAWAPTRTIKTPDFERRRFVLSDSELLTLARWAVAIERHYSRAIVEFIINDTIKIHPLALTRFEQVEDAATRERIEELTLGYENKSKYFVERLARGIATIAASQYPEQVIVRLSDFKTNEYAQLVGGAQFEPHEENQKLGFRGACRYYSDRYKDGFALECRALRRARVEIGLDNVIVMVPFVRSPAEADRVIAAMAEHGLTRGREGLELYMMCEVPSNVFLVEHFAERFDGFSIGSNDLTQLILGVDRDSEELSRLFDERDEAVKVAIAQVIERGHAAGCKVGICGQAPSDYPEFARFLVDCGIDSISLNPDSVLAVLHELSDTRYTSGRGGA